MVAVLLVASSRLELRLEDDGCVSSLHSGSFNKVGVVGESIWGFVQMVDCVLVEFEAEGRELLLEEGEASCQGVRVAVEGEVVLINVHSRVWVRVSHPIFNGGKQFCALSQGR